MKNIAIEKLLQSLRSYDDFHDLHEGISSESIHSFETNNKIILPQDIKRVYECFDGGELFVPGIVIYGLLTLEKYKTIRDVNSKDAREDYSIPKEYLIFAKLNFGDLICVNLNSPFDVIQWDHERNESYCTWSSVSEWIEDFLFTYKP